MLKHASFGLDYAADLHRHELLRRVIEERASDLVNPKWLQGCSGSPSSSIALPTGDGEEEEVDSDNDSV